MSASPIQGWALPTGITPPATSTREVDGGAVLRWADFDAVGVLRLVERLREGREELLSRPAASIARVLGAVGDRFLDDSDPLHRAAVDAVVRESGLSRPMSSHVVRGMAWDWTSDRLLRVVREEFGDPPEVDGFVERGPDARRIAAYGDAFAVHVASGSVPGVAATSLIRSLLVKTPVLVKPGAGDVALTVLFARALSEADSALADACAVSYWPGGQAEIENVVVPRADRLVIYGDDRTVAGLRSRAAPGAPVVVYGHRVGFSVVGPEAWDAEALAEAIGAFDQRGCVTTHQVFVIGDADRAVEAAEEIADALADLQKRLPRGTPSGSEAAAVRQRVETAELRAAADDRVRVHGGATIGWAVTVEPDPALEPGPTGRVVRVVAAKDAAQVALEVDRMRLHLQTAGHGGFTDGGADLAERLGRVGVTRVVPFASVAFPPGWWLHDGGGPLKALVRRVEWEPAPPEAER